MARRDDFPMGENMGTETFMALRASELSRAHYVEHRVGDEPTGKQPHRAQSVFAGVDEQ